MHTMAAPHEDLKLPDNFFTVSSHLEGQPGVERARHGPSGFVRRALHAGELSLAHLPDARGTIAKLFNDGNLVVRLVRGQRPLEVDAVPSLAGVIEMVEVRVAGNTLDLMHDGMDRGYAGLRFRRQGPDSPWVPTRVTTSTGPSIIRPVTEAGEFPLAEGTPHYAGLSQFIGSPVIGAAQTLERVATAGDFFDSEPRVEVLPSTFP